MSILIGRSHRRILSKRMTLRTIRVLSRRRSTKPFLTRRVPTRKITITSSMWIWGRRNLSRLSRIDKGIGTRLQQVVFRATGSNLLCNMAILRHRVYSSGAKARSRTKTTKMTRTPCSPATATASTMCTSCRSRSNSTRCTMKST